jgi:ammonia channel protein AmtB
MQCGFALFEAGAVRAKNVTNILLKNFLDAREFLKFLATNWSFSPQGLTNFLKLSE